MNNETVVTYEKTNDLTKEKQKTKVKTEETCVHEFEMDLIDIDPDRSMIIHYCKLCGYTKR